MTVDGGKAWRRHSLPGPTARPVYTAIDFPTGMIGWAVGADGMVARTIDGGRTWTAQTSGVTTRLNAVCFTDAEHGFAVGAGGVIVSTADGEIWTPQTSGTTVDLGSVTFVTDDEGWSVGKPGWTPAPTGVLLHTTDGGEHWE